MLRLKEHARGGSRVPNADTDGWTRFLDGQWLTNFGQWLRHFGWPGAPADATSFYLGLVVVLAGVLAGLAGTIAYYQELETRRYVHGLVAERTGITADDFLRLRKQRKLPNFAGVYVIHNTTQDLYYVGQSIHVMDRVNQHFTGHGNGDVYADFRYQNQFELFLIPLANSGYATLNALEKDAIHVYHAYDKGYNRTRGNRG